MVDLRTVLLRRRRGLRVGRGGGNCGSGGGGGNYGRGGELRGEGREEANAVLGASGHGHGASRRAGGM